MKVDIVANQGPMAVINTGSATIQANISKLRRPLDTVDLEELPDPRERTGTPVLWLSCEKKKKADVWEMFSDNSCLSAILDRQGLPVAAAVDLRTKKVENFTPQLLQGFWLVQAKEKKSQGRGDVPNCCNEEQQARIS